VGIRYARLDNKVKAFNNAHTQKELTQLLKKHPFLPAKPAHAAFAESDAANLHL
jgi:hypothetical protein